MRAMPTLQLGVCVTTALTISQLPYLSLGVHMTTCATNDAYHGMPHSEIDTAEVPPAPIDFAFPNAPALHCCYGLCSDLPRGPFPWQLRGVLWAISGIHPAQHH